MKKSELKNLIRKIINEQKFPREKNSEVKSKMEKIQSLLNKYMSSNRPINGGPMSLPDLIDLMDKFIDWLTDILSGDVDDDEEGQ